jgi:hypothetical protein
MKKIFIFVVFLTQLSNSQELALVRKEEKFGYISKNGDFVIQPKFKSAKDFSEGLAAVEENGLWGFIDTKGDWAIQATFNKVKYFNSGFCVVFKKLCKVLSIC